MNRRYLTIGRIERQSARTRQYHAVPALSLAGEWVKAAGFYIGQTVIISVEAGKIIIKPDTDAAEQQAAQEQITAGLAEVKARFAAVGITATQKEK